MLFGCPSKRSIAFELHLVYRRHVENIAKSNLRAERYSFTSAALAIGAVVVLIGIAPRNERALFLRDTLGQAKAFAAVVPPLDAVRAQLERGALDDLALRSARPDAAVLNRGSRRGTPSGTDLMPGTIPALLSNGPGGTQSGDGIGGTGNPTPTNNAAPNVITPAPTGGAAPAGGGGGVGPATIPPAPPGAPGLNVLPEPATWAMMLIGFMAIGGMIRRSGARRFGLSA